MADISRLVLTRKVFQSINIGGMATVTVEEIRGKAVRIAVEAPRGIAVHRQEIYERIHGAGPDDDGAAGVCVPAGPVTGPYRPPARAAARRPRVRGRRAEA
jgi:carbon storage regulator